MDLPSGAIEPPPYGEDAQEWMDKMAETDTAVMAERPPVKAVELTERPDWAAGVSPEFDNEAGCEVATCVCRRYDDGTPDERVEIYWAGAPEMPIVVASDFEKNGLVSLPWNMVKVRDINTIKSLYRRATD